MCVELMYCWVTALTTWLPRHRGTDLKVIEANRTLGAFLMSCDIRGAVGCRKDVCMHVYVCIYIYANPPLKPTVFNFLLCFTVIFVGFCRQKQPAFFAFIWRLWMLDHEESWCFMCRYNDIFWWYLQRFQLPYCVPNKGFQFKHWQNAHGTVAKCIFQALHCFFQCFNSFLWHMKFWILHAFRSSRHFIWWSIW